MAIRYAVAAGNWSNTATWNGGTLPASTDDVYANNFTVTIDQSITVNTLRSTSNASPVIAAGGSFTVTVAATLNITAGLLTANTATSGAAILLISAGTATVTVNGAVQSGNASAREGIRISSHTGTVNINGNLTCGDTSGFSNAPAVYVNSACTLNVTGNVSCAGAQSAGIQIAAGATVTVTGDVTAGSSLGYGVLIGGVNANVTVNGNVTGGTATTAYGVNVNASGARATIAGSINGGSASRANGLFVGTGSARIDALLRFGSSGCAPVDGTGGVVQFVRTGSYLGIEAPSDDNFPASTGPTITVQRYTTGNPAPANVRAGTTYGPGGTSTGTLAVPPAASVASGVPVDNTTGTAALKLSDVLAGTGNQIAAVFP